jgi:hypothetical protein
VLFNFPPAFVFECSNNLENEWFDRKTLSEL